MNSLTSDAIAAVYACATDPARWPEALQRIADCFGDVGGLLIHRRDDGSFATVVSPSLRECADAYEREWWRHDFRAQRAMDYAYGNAAGALTDRHVVSDAEMAAHPFYTEFLDPFGLRWVASVQVSPQAGVQVGLSILRAASKPPFGDHELERLADLGRHVEQSLRLGVRLVDAEAVSLGLGDGLARLGTAAFVVDGAGRVVFANGKAQHLASRAFAVKDHLLVCQSPAHQKNFAAMLQSSASIAAGCHPLTKPGLPLVIEADGIRLAVYVLPIADEARSFGARAGPLSVVLAIDIAPGVPLNPALLRDVYGLTLGEARVAALVGAGVSPRETALKLRIAEETVRSVLKRVFAKLDVSRQAELTELFTRLKSVGEAQ